jgi:Na+/melibiose symporter-like transporter
MGIGVLVLLAALTIGIIQPDQTAWIAASLILLGIGWSFVNVAGSALFSAVVSPGARAASQGGVDALSNLCGAIAAFLAGPLLAVTSFGALSAVAIAVLLPLVMLLAVQRRTTVGR